MKNNKLTIKYDKIDISSRPFSKIVKRFKSVLKRLFKKRVPGKYYTTKRIYTTSGIGNVEVFKCGSEENALRALNKRRKDKIKSAIYTDQNGYKLTLR